MNADHKTKFIDATNLRHAVKNNFTFFIDVIKQLGKIHNDLVKKNTKNDILFGLDTFHFQIKLLESDCAEMDQKYTKINNRMYCEYYKLLKRLNHYILEKEISGGRPMTQYPVYDILNSSTYYSFTLIETLYDDIIKSIEEVHDYYVSLEEQLGEYKSEQSLGLNIESFVEEYEYIVLNVKHKETVFINNLDYFLQFHKKQLERLYSLSEHIKKGVMEDINVHNLSIHVAEMAPSSVDTSVSESSTENPSNVSSVDISSASINAEPSTTPGGHHLSFSSSNGSLQTIDVNSENEAVAKSPDLYEIFQFDEESSKHIDVLSNHGFDDDEDESPTLGHLCGPVESSRNLDDAIDASTDDAIDASTDDAIDASTDDAIDASTDDAIDASTDDAIDASTDDAIDASTDDAIDASTDDANINDTLLI